MRFGLSAFFALSIGFTVPAFAQNDVPITIAPSTPWEVNFAEAKCRAARIFGEGDERTILFLEQIAPSTSPRWVMAGKVADDLRSGGDLTVQFGPGVDAFQMRASKGTTLGDFGRAFRSASIRKPNKELKARQPENESEDAEDRTEEVIGLPLLDVEEGKSIEWVEFRRGNRPPRRLATGNFGQLFELLNTCMSDLVRTWGIDVEAQKRRARGPRPLNLSEIANRIQQYYPDRAERWGRQADLSVRVMVDKTGAITECRITNVSVAEDFDSRACEEFSQVGRFEPAVDTDGEPMDSFYVTSIQYRLY